MKVIDQTIFGSPNGNCFQACVASVLELSLEKVPHFCNEANPKWLIELEEWLRPLGLAPLMVQGKGCPTLDNVYSLAGGPAQRGNKHEVVYFGNTMIHDPHPDRSGLEKVEDFIFFVTLDPSL